MAKPNFIIVLDDNLDSPYQWQASAEAQTFAEAKAVNQHDATCWVVPRQPGDQRRDSTTLINKHNGQRDRGAIYELTR